MISFADSLRGLDDMDVSLALRVSRPTVNRWKSGRTVPSAPLRAKALRIISELRR